MTSTDIAVRDHGNGQVAERDIVDGWLSMASDVIKLANVIAPTEFVPAEYRDNPPAVAAAILSGRELGIGPMTALRHVQMVKGTPTLSAEYKRARVLAAGHEFDVLELNTQRCRVSGRRKGSNKPPLEVTYTMDDAKTAGLLTPSRSGRPGAWQTRPRRMLFARAGSELCDFLFADVVNGLPTAELVADATDGDEFSGYNEAPAQETPKPAGTAQRKRRQPHIDQGEQGINLPADQQTYTGPPDPTAVPTSAASRTQGTSSHGNADQPPLPGEELGTDLVDVAAGIDYDTPGTASPDQLTALWATFTEDYGFGKDDKQVARETVEKIIGRQLDGATTKDLARNEAAAAIDTLKRCGGDWDKVRALTEAGDKPGE
jgi:hypothetical protein